MLERQTVRGVVDRKTGAAERRLRHSGVGGTTPVIWTSTSAMRNFRGSFRIQLCSVPKAVSKGFDGDW